MSTTGATTATNSAEAMVLTVVDALGHEPGYLNVVLDLLLRRGIIDPTAAADWSTTSSALEGLLNSYWSHAHVQVVADRAVDIARAAIARRRDLGVDMCLDETANLSLLASSSGVDKHVNRPAMEQDKSIEVVEKKEGDANDGDNNGDDDDDGEGSSKKRRRNRDDEGRGGGESAMESAVGADEDDEDEVCCYCSCHLYYIIQPHPIPPTIININRKLN